LFQGADPKETASFLHSLADLLLANRAWMASLKPGAAFFAILFTHFTRTLADLGGPQAGNQQHTAQQQQQGNNTERFKSSLMAVCEFELRERFPDLLMLGRDLLLGLMRVAKLPAFQWCWRALQTAPESLAPRFGGIPQLMATPCASNLHPYRVSLHVQRKVEFLLKGRAALTHTKMLEWFAKAYLANGQSMRAECMRFVWYHAWVSQQHQQQQQQQKDGG